MSVKPITANKQELICEADWLYQLVADCGCAIDMEELKENVFEYIQKEGEVPLKFKVTITSE